MQEAWDHMFIWSSSCYFQPKNDFYQFKLNHIQANLYLRNPFFSFLNRELFDLRNIYVVDLKTGCTKNVCRLNFQIEICLNHDSPVLFFNFSEKSRLVLRLKVDPESMILTLFVQKLTRSIWQIWSLFPRSKWGKFI